ncbi:hypothetical protein MRX96_017458 [Rhipicephalus microplus]
MTQRENDDGSGPIRRCQKLAFAEASRTDTSARPTEEGRLLRRTRVGSTAVAIASDKHRQRRSVRSQATKLPRTDHPAVPLSTVADSTDSEREQIRRECIQQSTTPTSRNAE